MSKQDLDQMLEQAEEAIKKGEDLSEISADHHGKEKSKVEGQKPNIADEIKKAKIEKNEEEEGREDAEGKEEVVEGEDIKEDEEEKAEKTEKKEEKKPAKKGKAKVRSKKYQEVKSLVENRKYSADDAIELVKKTSTSKFDGSVEVHVRLLGKSGKPEQVRGLIQYPNPTGRKINVVVLDDAKIEEILTSGKADADIYLAKPDQMPKVAKLAKILGPKGKMPNPKSGTVTADPEKSKKELEGGQVEYRTDSFGIIHQVIGKLSTDSQKLTQNLKALVNTLPTDKIASISISATMGPGIKVAK